MTQGIIPKTRGTIIRAIMGEMMLCASLKLLAKRDKVSRKEAKKTVSGRRREKNMNRLPG